MWVRLDENWLIAVAEAAARTIADDTGFDLAVGKPLPGTERVALTNRFAEPWFEVVEGDYSETARALFVTDEHEPVEYGVLTFSGGVSESLPYRETYGDLGPELGTETRNVIDDWECPIDTLGTDSRATVVGSNLYTV